MEAYTSRLGLPLASSSSSVCPLASDEAGLKSTRYLMSISEFPSEEVRPRLVPEVGGLVRMINRPRAACGYRAVGFPVTPFAEVWTLK